METQNKIQKLTISESQVKNKEFFSHFRDQLICSIDNSLPVDPIMTSCCEATFCNECLQDYVKANKSCPNKCNKFEMKQCNRASKQIQEGIIIICKCKQEKNLLSYPGHILNECEFVDVNCWVCSSIVKRKSLVEIEKNYLNLENKLNSVKYVYKNFAIDLCSLGRYTEAIDILLRTIKIDPEFDTGYLYLGIAYLKINDYKKGLLYLLKSLEIDTFVLHPKNIIMNFEYKNKELFLEFINELEKDNDKLESLFNLGIIYTMKNQYSTAEKYYKKALQLNPNYIQAHIGLSLIGKFQLNYEDANKHLETALTLNNYTNKYYLKTYAWLLVNQKRYNEALKYHIKITEMDTSFVSGILNYGHSKCEQDIDDEALRYFKRATIIDSYYFLAYSNIAVIDIKKGKLSDAKKIYYNNIRYRKSLFLCLLLV